jgi:uncharacterized protein
MASATPVRHEPRIVVGEVRHARLAPFEHRFRYRAFYLQLPLKSLGRSAGGWAWGVNKIALLSVHDRDHGDGRPLLEWAEDTLKKANVHDVDGEIWLQTFPKMFGYVFKPVSFWFCESANGSLRAVIAEVNNTFGDRHVYVLTKKECAIHNGETLSADKAFYVSPFFEIQGRYEFRFFKSGIGGRDLARIEYQDNASALLLTSMSGQSKALSASSALAAWFSHPFHSLGVIARIHWQAVLLWAKGAKFVSRPKPAP